MLTFQRIPGVPHAYFANGDTKRYRVFKETGAVARTTSAWRLEVLDLVITAGIVHAYSQPVLQEIGLETRAMAYTAANAYNDFGDDYQDHEHEHRSRFSAAVEAAYK
jgi:hypothetical protein